MRTPGVRIKLATGKQFVFWSFEDKDVLQALGARGVRIVEVPGKPPKVWLGA